VSATAAEHHHHGPPRPEDWPIDRHYGRATSAKVGMWIFLLSDALMFAGLLLAYGILRGGSEYWQCTPELAQRIGCAVEPELGINFTAGLTFLLICSSVSMVLTYAAIIERNRKQAMFWMAMTVLGGVLFLTGQYQEYFGIVHDGLSKTGLVFGATHYATTFYCITSFHGAHVFTGTVINLVMLIRIARGRYDDGNENHIEVCGLFWHFVDLIWIVVFTVVYLIPK
jgi:heme/copper-type cytochrome/quinol oxidase subunit 3